MKINILIAVFICTATQLFAQTNPYTFQYFNNPFVLNPARTGDIEDADTRVYLSYKKQWDNLEGRHSSQIVSIDKALRQNKISIGGLYFREQMHIISFQGGQASFAYTLPINPRNKTKVMLGTNIGFYQTALDLDFANIRDLDDELLTSGAFNLTKITWGAGAALTAFERLKLDIAYQRFIGKRLFSKDFETQYQQRWNIFAAYDIIKKGSDKRLRYFAFQPSTISRFYVNGIVELGINAKGTYHFSKGGLHNAWAALGYRTQISGEANHLNISIGVDYEQVSGAIHFESALGKFNSLLSNTLEFQVGYKFGKEFPRA